MPKLHKTEIATKKMLSPFILNTDAISSQSFVNSGPHKIKFWTWCKFSCKSPNVCILLKLCCPFIFTSRHRNLLVPSLWKPFRTEGWYCEISSPSCAQSSLSVLVRYSITLWFKPTFSEWKGAIFKMLPKTRTEKQKQHCLPLKMLAAPKVN